MHSRKIDPSLLRLIPFFPQDLLMLLTPYSNLYNEHFIIKHDAPDAKGLGLVLLPGLSPVVSVKSTGIFSPFSSRLKSMSNPHSVLAMLIYILFSATCIPGQIRRPPPNAQWALFSGSE